MARYFNASHHRWRPSSAEFVFTARGRRLVAPILGYQDLKLMIGSRFGPYRAVDVWCGVQSAGELVRCRGRTIPDYPTPGPERSHTLVVRVEPIEAPMIDKLVELLEAETGAERVVRPDWFRTRRPSPRPHLVCIRGGASPSPDA